MDIDTLIGEMEAEQRKETDDSLRPHRHNLGAETAGTAAATAAAAGASATAGTAIAPASQPGAAAVDAAGVTPSSSQWDALWRHARELEKQTRSVQAAAAAGGASSTAAAKSDWTHEKQLFALRQSLGSVYSSLIALDVRQSSLRDVEQLRWKSCVYKQMESLRRLLRAATPSAQRQASSRRRYAQQLERFARLHVLTRAVLADSMDYYERLFFERLPLAGWEAVPSSADDSSDRTSVANHDTSMHREQQQPQQPSRTSHLRLGHVRLRPLPASSSSLPDLARSSSSRSSAAAAATAPTSSSPTHLLRLHSCHRCLIFRGDLERYSQLMLHDEAAVRWLGEHRRVNGQEQQQPQAGEEQPLLSSSSAVPSQQWQRVRRFYSLALTLLPSVGNPFNQLAVLDTYERAPLAAVYHYFRALSAAAPFPTAQVNAQLLLEKRRDAAMYRAHERHHEANANQTSALFPNQRVCVFQVDSSHDAASAATDAAAPDMDTMWLQVFDLLFCKTTPHPHASALPCVAHAALHRFDAFVSQAQAQAPRQAATSADASSPSRSVYTLRLLLNLLYCAQHSRPHTDVAAPAASPMGDDRDPGAPGPGCVPDPLAPLLPHTASLTLCCELMSLLIASVSSARSRRIGVVCVFLAWLQLHPRALDDAGVALAVQRSFFGALAHLLHTVAGFMASDRRHDAAGAQKKSAGEENGSQLFEEAEVRGCALLLPPSSPSPSSSSSSSSSFSAGSPLLGQVTWACASDAPEDADDMMDADLDPAAAGAGASPAERRCVKLLRLGAWMANHGVGIARDVRAAASFGAFRSLLEPASSVLPVAGAEAAMTDRSNTMMAPPPLPPPPVALSSIPPVSLISSTSAAVRPDPSAQPAMIAAPPLVFRGGYPLFSTTAAAVAGPVPHNAEVAPSVAAPSSLGPADAVSAEQPPAAAPPAPHGSSLHDAVEEDCHMGDEHGSALPLRVHRTSAVMTDAAAASAAPITTATAAAAAPAVGDAAAAPPSTVAVADSEPGWRVSPAARAAGLELMACYSRVLFPSMSFPTTSAHAAPALAATHGR